jgi:cell division protein FtsB
MWELQRRRKFRNMLYSKTAIVILLIVAFFLARATWSVYQKNVESALAMEGAQKEAAVLESRQKILERENERLKTPNGFEAELRAKHSVIKPGEKIYIIVDPKDQVEMEKTENAGWWNKVKHFFGDEE